MQNREEWEERGEETGQRKERPDSLGTDLPTTRTNAGRQKRERGGERESEREREREEKRSDDACGEKEIEEPSCGIQSGETEFGRSHS